MIDQKNESDSSKKSDPIFGARVLGYVNRILAGLEKRSTLHYSVGQQIDHTLQYRIRAGNAIHI
jgi:hypothetical protein